MANPKDELKRTMFCREYVANGFDATRAYQTVSPKSSKNVAKNKACQWLKEPGIEETINKLMERKLRVADITFDRVVDELSAMAFSTPGEAQNYIDEHKISPAVRVMLKDGEKGRETLVEYKPETKIAALKALGDMLKTSGSKGSDANQSTQTFIFIGADEHGNTPSEDAIHRTIEGEVVDDVDAPKALTYGH